MASFKLKRTKQCSKCPWKVSTNPFEIPDGYCDVKHANLKSTIAKEGDLNIGSTLKVMACHHSKPGSEEYCIGWLKNQLGEGNNIGLRLRMLNCENISKIKTYGKQHSIFEETLPENKNNK